MFFKKKVFRYLTESVTNAQNEQINLNHISATSFQQPQPKQTQQNSIPSVTRKSLILIIYKKILNFILF